MKTMKKTRERVCVGSEVAAPSKVFTDIFAYEMGSAVFQHDSLERVAHVFAAVDGFLDVVVELFPLEHFQSIDAPGEQLGHRGVMIVIADTFLVMNLNELVGEVGQLSRFTKLRDGFIHPRQAVSSTSVCFTKPEG